MGLPGIQGWSLDFTFLLLPPFLMPEEARAGASDHNTPDTQSNTLDPFDADGPGTSDLDVTFVGGDMVTLFREFHIPEIISDR